MKYFNSLYSIKNGFGIFIYIPTHPPNSDRKGFALSITNLKSELNLRLSIIIFFLLLYPLTYSCSGEQINQQSDSWQELQGTCSAIDKIAPVQSCFPQQDWWKQFNDDNLNHYVDLALKDNFKLKAATNRISEANALVGESKSILRPSVSFQPTYQRNQTSSTILNFQSQNQSKFVSSTLSNVFTLPIQASYEIDVFGKNRLKVQSTKQLEEEAKEEQRVVELQVSSEVAGSYFNIIQTDALIKETEALIDDATQSVKLRRQLFSGGVIPYDIVLLTEQDLSTYRENLAQYKSLRSVFCHQLCILTAIKPLNEKVIKRATIDQINFPESIKVGLPSELITHRPDVAEAETVLARANIDVKEARKEFLPTFNLFGDTGFSSSTLSQLFDWRSRIYQIGANAIQSLYSGGFKTANLKYQKAVMEESTNNYYSVILSAFNDVENSLALFNDNYSEYQENLTAIKTAEHYSNLALIRYNSGIATKLDYLDADRQVLMYQLLSKQNKSKSLIDLVSLYKALGGGYTK